MQTEAQICNLALLRVGQRQTIDSLNEATEPAQLCSVLYPAARDALLCRHPWRWATRHQVLAELTETRSGWAHVYALPTDCLEPRYIFSGIRPGQGAVPLSSADLLGVTAVSMLPAINGRATQIPFSVEASVDGARRVLVTDWDDAELVYTAALEVVPVFPPLFCDALAWRLTADLALSLAVKPALAEAAEKYAAQALGRAAAADLNAAQPDPRPDSSYIAVRA